MPSAPSHDERLTAPWWWWPVAAGLTGLLGGGLHLGYGGARAVVPYVAVGGACAAAILLLNRTRVRVCDGELTAGSARLPLAVTGDVTAVDRDGVRLLLGREADPRAFTLVRPWIATAVSVPLHDPEDDTPYWLVSTRRPADLVAAISRERAARG